MGTYGFLLAGIISVFAAVYVSLVVCHNIFKIENKLNLGRGIILKFEGTVITEISHNHVAFLNGSTMNTFTGKYKLKAGMKIKVVQNGKVLIDEILKADKAGMLSLESYDIVVWFYITKSRLK